MTSSPLQERTPRRVARLPTEIQSSSASVNKAHRSTLTANDVQKLKFRAEEGLKHKFKLMSTDKIETVDSLKVACDLSIRIEEFTNTLRSYDMIDTFTILKDFMHNVTEDIYEPSTEATHIDLIRYYRDAPLSLVKKFSDWLTNPYSRKISRGLNLRKRKQGGGGWGCVINIECRFSS